MAGRIASNAYETVAITQYLQDGITVGTVNWTVRNLNTDRLIDGTLIPEIQDNIEWYQAFLNNQPAWCYYNNDPANGPIYGKLYNGYASNGTLLTIPGFRIATQDDYYGLFIYYGYPTYDSSYFRETGYEHWNTSFVPGLDGIGFRALGGGYRDYNSGNFYGFKNIASFGSDEVAKTFNIDNQNDVPNSTSDDFRATSIRLIKI
jgi:uncharacterized protein (TIGR02145 family)